MPKLKQVARARHKLVTTWLGNLLRLALLAAAIAGVPDLKAANILWDLNGTLNATLQDFINAGVTEDISADSVTYVPALTAASMSTNGITLSYVSNNASGSFTAAANKRYPNALLDDYLFLNNNGPVTLRISGLASVLSPSTNYKLYLFGSGDSANQQAQFTFNGQTVSNLSSTAPGPAAPQNGRTAVFAFTTGGVVSNSLDFIWARTGANQYAGFNGFAIVSAANPDPDKDGLTTTEESALGTNPNAADTDLDGSPDGVEVVEGTNPNLGSSKPSGNPVLAGVTNNQPLGAFLNGTLPPVTPGSGTGASWTWEDAYPSANVGGLGELIGMASEPSSNYVYALERNGGVWRVENTPTANTKTKVLGITVDTSDNGGIHTFVFHPQYGIPGSPYRNYCFVYYSIYTNSVFYYRVSRFTRDEVDGQLKNELVMIQQRARDRGQHAGGGMIFDTNGFLLVTFGDFSYNTGKYPENLPKNQWYQDAQRVDRIFQSAVLRLDVDQRGGSISAPPTRTLQGDTGPYAIPGTTQSCPPDHNFYDPENRSGIGYYIPLDNYFVLNPPPAGVGGVSAAGIPYPAHGPALQERHALGVRNPWRMAVDREDGEVLWFNVGSNGPLQYEEVDRLVPGGNYGWPFAEGIVSDTAETGFNQPPGDYAPVFLGVTNRASPRQMDPLRMYAPGSGGGVTVVGGVIYRGSKFPSLYGKLIYGDHQSGTVWVLDYKGKSPSNYVNTVLMQGVASIRQIVTDPSGQDILFATADTIKRLVNIPVQNPEPPALLSQTGVFTNLVTLAPRAGLIAYTPASPLWSDRAAKPRWVALPNASGIPGVHDLASERITYSDNSEWTFPQGTVFVKQFNLPLDERDPENPLLQKRLETRFLTRGTNGVYYAVTYKWNASDTDAQLLPTGDVSAYAESFLVTNTAGGTYQQTWNFPSRLQCMECHQAAAGFVLGVKSRQLNHHQDYGTNVANQISTWRELGWFDNPPSLTNLPLLATSKRLDDVTISSEWRVRSYLDSNCSHCHRPGAQSGRATFDVRLTTPTDLAGLIDAFPAAGDLGLTNARIIRPRDPHASVLLKRDALVDGGLVQMPPLAKTLLDHQYLVVLTNYIQRIGLPRFDQYANALGVSGGPDEDVDKDGTASGLEFLLTENAAVPNSQAAYKVSVVGDDILLTIPLSGDALSDGFAPFVIGSTNLFNWYPGGNAGSGLILQSNTAAPGVNGQMIWKFLPGFQGYVRVGTQTPPP